MSAIKAWSMTICLISVVCTIIEVLFPSGKMEKIFKVVLGIFLLCALLVPLKNIFKNINFDAKKPEISVKDGGKLKSTTDEQTKMTAKKNLERSIKNLLEEKSIKPEKINIIMDTNSESSISIKKIEIFLARGDESKRESIKNELEKKLELKIDVVVGSE